MDGRMHIGQDDKGINDTIAGSHDISSPEGER